ncbi:MAG: hypothetical protein JHC70_23890 [Rhodococcus sp.]|nr:hypothetical protein [Rhodococcus sp. (in: high G+C Gram-positive bacteria)]MBJ7325370.1 hypothetical protein [Rhodococcus sp. (in: high G+C Gram-positive bacteria)]
MTTNPKIARIRALLEEYNFEEADAAFWASRPILQHIHDFAQSRLAAPRSTLLAVMLREVAMIDPRWVLPPIVGSAASLNLFGVFVGESGVGKGISEAVSREVLTHNEIVNSYVLPNPTLGSGEGIVAQYMRLTKPSKDSPATPFQYNDRALFSAAEIDTLSAVTNRSGSTLFPELCKAFSGETLGHSYAAAEKGMLVPRHGYRMNVGIGAQPTRSNVLLQQIDSGLPQRFVWLPTHDSYMPDYDVTQPEPFYLNTVAFELGPDEGLREFTVDPAIRAEIRAVRRAVVRSGTGGIDSHKQLTKLKVAAAFAILDERSAVTLDDWALAGYVIHLSDETRRGIEDTIKRSEQAEATEKAEKRGKAEGITAKARIAEEQSAVTTQAAKLVRKTLAGEEYSGSDLRRMLALNDREPYYDRAVALLIDQQILKERPVTSQGQIGKKYLRLVTAEERGDYD